MSKTVGNSTAKRGQEDLDWNDAPNNNEEDEDSSPANCACESFDMDLAAPKFNTCKCGFPKSDHIPGYRAPPKALPSRPPPSSSSSKPPVPPPAVETSRARGGSVERPRGASVESLPAEAESTTSECDAFVIDLTSSEFGMCKCGKKKTQHTKQAMFAKPKTSGGFASVQALQEKEKEEAKREAALAKSRREEEARAKQEFMERERTIAGHSGAAPVVVEKKPEPVVEEEEAEPIPVCLAFDLDLTGAKFGTCKCGQPKTMHTREALNAKPVHHSTPRKSSVVEEEEDAHKESAVVCEAFELDMSAAEFGTCKCGLKKTAHSKAALFAKPVARTHVSGGMAPVSSGPVKTVAAAAAPPPKPVVVVPAAAAPPPPKPVAVAPVVVMPPPAPIEVEEVEEEHAPPSGQVLDPPRTYRALYDFDSPEAEDLTFTEGEMIEVVEVIDEDWLRGRIGHRTGVFPKSYAEVYDATSADAVEEEQVEQQHEEEEVPPPVMEEVVVEEEEVVQEEEPVAAEAAPSGEFPFTVYAQFDFESENEGDLPLKTGDEVTVLSYIDEQWWKGQCRGVEGMFPAEFVARDPPPVIAEEEPPMELAEEPHQPEPAATGAEFVVAQFDFQAENEGDLSFQAGDRIEVLETIDENWMRGRLNGEEGILPISYITQA